MPNSHTRFKATLMPTRSPPHPARLLGSSRVRSSAARWSRPAIRCRRWRPTHSMSASGHWFLHALRRLRVGYSRPIHRDGRRLYAPYLPFALGRQL